MYCFKVFMVLITFQFQRQGIMREITMNQHRDMMTGNFFIQRFHDNFGRFSYRRNRHGRIKGSFFSFFFFLFLIKQATIVSIALTAVPAILFFLLDKTTGYLRIVSILVQFGQFSPKVRRNSNFLFKLSRERKRNLLNNAKLFLYTYRELIHLLLFIFVQISLWWCEA